MKTIGIVVAMQSEFELVAHILENSIDKDVEGVECKIGELYGKRIILLRSGIGKVNAAMRVTSMIAEMKPDYIVNSGVAGGIGKGLRPGDIVVGSEVCYHDVWCGEGEYGQIQGCPLMFPANLEMINAVKAISNDKIHLGLICTGDQFICDLSALQLIKKNFPGGQAVDMESAAIAQVCYLKKVPFLSLRIISDTPGMEHDNTSQYFDFFTEAPKMTFAVLQQFIKNI